MSQEQMDESFQSFLNELHNSLCPIDAYTRTDIPTIYALITDSRNSVAQILRNVHLDIRENTILIERNSMVDAEIELPAREGGRVKYRGNLLITIPGIFKVFCTHCCELIRAKAEDIQQHVENCYYEIGKYGNERYCHCCNYKSTYENAQRHFNSPEHETKVSFIHESMARNSVYYISANSISNTIEPFHYLDRGITVDHLPAQRYASIVTNEYIMRMTPEEKLTQLINKYREYKKQRLTVPRILKDHEKAQIKELKKLCECLLSEINNGARSCYRDTNEGFVQSKYMFEAVKQVAIKLTREEDIDDNGPSQYTYLAFLIRQTDYEEKCFICKEEHSIQNLVNRAECYKMVTLVMESF